VLFDVDDPRDSAKLHTILHAVSLLLDEAEVALRPTPASAQLTVIEGGNKADSARTPREPRLTLLPGGNVG
jgi:hypothetical protein